MRPTAVVVIGGGQAGLAISHLLTLDGIDHVVLERDSVGAAWRSRWDSFTLVTPNWTVRLPGAAYGGTDPDGFMPRDEIVAHLQRYAASFGAPVRTGVTATEVTAIADGGYRVETTAGPLDARAVVVATGTFQTPRRPALGSLPEGVLDLHSSAYRNPGALPPGAVLVVGSGQSGAQIAEELLEAGRRVFLSVSRAPRIPRRYRGRDLARWFETMGFVRTVDQLDSPAERFSANAHVSGKRGGHTLNLHRFARDGMTLLGRVAEIHGGTISLVDDLHANLARADASAAEIRHVVDGFVAQAGIDAPTPDDENSDDYAGDDGFHQPRIDRIDLASEQVTSVIWSAGYGFDFSWVRPVALDETGYPVHRRGVTSSPGLYFLGLHFLYTMKSGLLWGVGDDAEYLAGEIRLHLGTGN
ncbi:MAG TPA: NAD(P)-binding domain-containing protein [Candidatus Limnocylindria bacterium]|nr:NAD(P)-binding domain-containing protein [Candidatus Limnocylindria bacterium]